MRQKKFFKNTFEFVLIIYYWAWDLPFIVVWVFSEAPLGKLTFSFTGGSLMGVALGPHLA